MALYRHYATVEFEGKFPLELLHLQQAYPSQISDARSLKMSMTEGRGGRLVLEAISTSKLHWIDKHWKSYEIRCLYVSVSKCRCK